MDRPGEAPVVRPGKVSAARPANDAFSGVHPTLALVFFVVAIGTPMVLFHPVLSPIGLTLAVAYAIRLSGRRAVRFTLVAMLPLLILATVFNPLFSHAGVTLLSYLPDGNPLTLESIIYGLFTGIMIVTVIMWFACLNQVLTSDKIHYLCGRLWPALALLFSMSLRLVPRFKAQVRTIALAQRGLGRSLGQGSLLRRARSGLNILSILITWALENSVEVSDSMRSRGYGLPGRTAFHRFRFDRRDRQVGLWLGGGLLGIGLGTAFGLTSMKIYPALSWPGVSLPAVIVWLTYAAFLAVPLALDAAEAVTWRAISSNN